MLIAGLIILALVWKMTETPRSTLKNLDKEFFVDEKTGLFDEDNWKKVTRPRK